MSFNNIPAAVFIVKMRHPACPLSLINIFTTEVLPHIFVNCRKVHAMFLPGLQDFYPSTELQGNLRMQNITIMVRTGLGKVVTAA